MFDTPANFPPMGFQLGAIYLRRGWTGSVKLTDWNAPVDGVERVDLNALFSQRCVLESAS